MSKILAKGMITLTQLYEGAQVILTPAVVLIPCNSEETPKPNAYINASTNVKAFLGTMDITSGITLGELEYSDSTVRASKTGTKVSITTITTRTGYVDIPVSATINGETIDLGKHRFNFVKQIDGQTGQPGTPGDPGFGYTLNIKGGTRGIAYAANGTNPEPNTSSQFSVELLKNGVKVSNPASISWTCGGNLSGVSSVATFTPAIKSTYASGSSYVKVSVKEFAASLAVEETIPIICTKHADGLDWINEWNNQYVQVGTEKIITPKIFAGTKNSANELTGVAIGRDVLGGNANKVIGIVGYKKNTPVFSLDQDANFFVSSSGNAGDIKNGTNNAKGIYFDGDNLYVSGKVKISGGSTIGESNTLVEDVINNSNLGAQANNKIDNLSIGGRNYCTAVALANLKSADNENPMTFNNAHEHCPNGFYAVGNKNALGIIRLPNVINSNGYWTVSFDLRGSQNTSVGMNVDICGLGTTTVKTTDNNSWKRVSVTVNVTNYSKDEHNYIDFSRLAWAYFFVRNIKVEQGNKATDWTPAPEDIQADINTKANVSDVYKKTETYTKSETNSAIEVAKNEINLGISSTYETKTNVETKVNNAINNIQIGGRNLLAGTKTFSEGKVAGSVISEVYEGFTVLYKDNTTGASYSDVCAWTNSITTKPNAEYTLSFYAKGAGEFVSYFHPDNVISGFSSEGATTTSLDGAIRHQLTADWKKYWITWKVHPNASGKKTVLPFRLFSGSCGYICGVMFEEGNKASAWSPAPDDVNNNIGDAIDNIKIGGRNLISPAKVQAYTQYNTVKPNNTNGWTITKKEAGVSVAIKQSDFTPEVGKTYTFSGYATVNGQPVSEGFFANDRLNTYLQPADRIVVNNGYFEVVQKWNASSVWILHCALAGVTNGVVVDFSNLMLEEGNKASAYTKNPNDVDEVIGSKANSADVYTKLETYTKIETDSAIKVAKDEINLGVSQTYETKTNVETKVNNAVSNIKIGGRNLVKDSNLNGLTSNAYGFGVRQIIGGLKNNTTYTMTVNGRSNPNGNTDGKSLMCYIYEESWTYGAWQFGIGETTDTTRSLTIPTGNNIEGKNVYVAFYWYPSGGDRTGNATVNWVKVEEGNKATDWTPAPEDVDSNISSLDSKITTTNNKVAELNVNLNGITQKVSSTETNVTNLQSKIDIDQSKVSGELLPQGYKANDGKGYFVKVGEPAKLAYESNKIKLKNKIWMTTDDFIRVDSSRAIHWFIEGTVSSNNQFYFGIERYDKNKQPVNGLENSGTIYFIDRPFTGQRKGVFNNDRKDTAYIRLRILNDWQGAGDSATAEISYMSLEQNSVSLTSEVTNTNSKVASLETNLNGISSKVSSVESSVVNINGNITNLQNRMSTAESKITSNAIINTVSSTINTAKQEAINSANSSTDNKLQGYATKSSLTQTTNSIVAKFETSGGYNLLKNSKAQNGTNFWLNNGGGISLATHSTYKTCFKTQAPSGIKYHEAIKLKNNTEYVYEGYIFSETAISGSALAPLHCWCMSTANTAGQSQLTVLDYRQSVPVNRWTKCYVHFRTASSGDVYFTPFVYVGGSATFNLWVTELSLSESSVESKWTPHPSEIYEGSTIIDATGVTVNNGALRVKNKSGSTVLSGDSNGNLVLAGNITSNATISGGTIVGSTLKSTNGDMRFDMNNGYMLLYNNGTKIGQTNKNSVAGTSIYGVSNGAEYGSYACLSAKVSSSASNYQMMITATGSDLTNANLKKGVNLGNTFNSNNWHFKLGSSTQLCWRQNGSNHDSFITEGSEGMLRLYGDNGMYLGYRNGDSNTYIIAIRENGNHVYPKSLSIFNGDRPATDNNGYSLEISAPLNMKGQSINQCSNIKTLGLEFIEPIAFNRNRGAETRTLKVTKNTQNIVEFIGSTAIKNGEAIVDLPNDVSFKNYVVLLTPIGLDRKVSMVEKNDDNFKIVGDDGIVDYVIKFESMDYANYIRKSISEDNTDIIVRSEEDKPKEIFVEN